MNVKSRIKFRMAGSVGALALTAVFLAGCGQGEVKGGIFHQAMADALHSVMESDRTVYTRLIINKLQNVEKSSRRTSIGKIKKTSFCLPKCSVTA